MNNNGSWSGGCIGLAVLLAMMLVLFHWLVTDGLIILLLIALFVVGYVIVQMSKSQKVAQDLAEGHMKQKEKLRFAWLLSSEAILQLRKLRFIAR